MTFAQATFALDIGSTVGGQFIPGVGRIIRIKPASSGSVPCRVHALVLCVAFCIMLFYFHPSCNIISSLHTFVPLYSLQLHTLFRSLAQLNGRHVYHGRKRQLNWTWTCASACFYVLVIPFEIESAQKGGMLKYIFLIYFRSQSICTIEDSTPSSFPIASPRRGKHHTHNCEQQMLREFHNRLLINFCTHAGDQSRRKYSS